MPHLAARARLGLAVEVEDQAGLGKELRRARAENAALQSRLVEARGRVQSIRKRLLALGVEP